MVSQDAKVATEKKELAHKTPVYVRRGELEEVHAKIKKRAHRLSMERKKRNLYMSRG